MAFEKVLLATGEGRSEYIQRRLTEGATVSAIHGEINAPGLYSGPEGKSWPTSVVIAQKAKVAPKPAIGGGTAIIDRKPDVKYEAVDGAVVPPQYEGILTPEDIAEIHEEAAAQVRAAQRKKARAQLLADARAELEREAVLEMRRGAARGDMVDVSIDLATYAPFLRIDGEVFYHGATYRVGRDKAKVLQEQMQRSWAHERSLAGPETNFFRQRNMLLNGRTGAVQGAEGLQR